MLNYNNTELIPLLPLVSNLNILSPKFNNILSFYLSQYAHFLALYDKKFNNIFYSPICLNAN